MGQPYVVGCVRHSHVEAAGSREVRPAFYKHTLEIMKGAVMEEFTMENFFMDQVIITGDPDTDDFTLAYEDGEVIAEHKTYDQCYNRAYRLGFRE